MIRVLQLNISQLENSFNSHLEKHFNLVLPSQPQSKPIDDRSGQLVTQEIVGKSQGELSSSDRPGEPVKDEEKRVLRNHDRTGNLWKEDCTKCKKLVISKIVMTRISSTLRWMTRTLISTSPVCQMRW